MMRELEEPCRSAIKYERCLGCSQLENSSFTSDINCKYIIKEKEYARKKRSN